MRLINVVASVSQKLLTLRQVARLLGLSNQRVYQMDRELKPILVTRGRKMRTRMYDPGVIDRVLGAREAPKLEYPDALKALWRAQTTKWRRHDEPNAITMEGFAALVSQQCNYCGSAPEVRRVGEFELLAHGIDVLDERNGLSRGNVVTCCYRCEVLRTVISAEEMVVFCQKVVDWSTKKGVRWLV